MKSSTPMLMLVAVCLIAACSTTKKTSTTTPTSALSSHLIYLEPPSGIHVPGNEELAAIQVQFKETTLEQLQEGHAIYTKGACTNCHSAKNIYQIQEAKLKNIIEDMSQRAKISDSQKDAVYKYVLSIKGTQTK